MDFQGQVTGWSQNSFPVKFSNVRAFQTLECVYLFTLKNLLGVEKITCFSGNQNNHIELKNMLFHE